MRKTFALTYGAKIEPDDDGFLVTFRDVENAFTWGASYREALFNAQEVLDLMLLDKLETGEDIGDPTPLKRGEVPISASPDVVAPILLHKLRVSQRKTMAHVAKKMDVPYQSYQRMETGKNNLTLKSFKKAVAAMGATIEITLRTAET